MPTENFQKGLSALPMMMHPIFYTINDTHKISSINFVKVHFT